MGDGWVSKTDLVRYVRCPYSFWLLDEGKIDFDDTVDEFQLRLLQEGVEFQDLVESEAVPIAVEPDNVEELFSQSVQVLGTPTYENHRLRIIGRPDGIDTARGALFPIEVKSHKDVQRTDELELAFYWLLLQPYRTRRVSKPLGYLILRHDGIAEEVEVPIRRHRIDKVRGLLADVRRARRLGVQPRVCGCNVCSRVKRDDVLASAREREDLTLIYGIGRNYAPALEQQGIKTWHDLMGCDPVDVVEFMKERRYFLSAATVQQWKHHAESYASGGPVVFGTDAAPAESFIALDLEYSAHTWLIGVCTVKGDRRDHHFLWSDDVRSLKRNLGELGELVAAEPALPILTWSGDGADIPQLRKDTERAKMPDLAASIQARHLDLYQYVWRNLRLPIHSLSLKDVGWYFGIPRLSPVFDGLEAELLYGRYRRATGKKKAEHRERLVDYNRDDLDALVETTTRVRELSLAARTPHLRQRKLREVS